MNVNSLLQKLGHRLSVFNRIYHMLDEKSLTADFNGLVLPHLDYADVVCGDQPGPTTQMKRLQSFQNRIAKKISKGKMTSAEAQTSLQCTTACEAFWTSVLPCARCNERRDP